MIRILISQESDYYTDMVILSRNWGLKGEQLSIYEAEEFSRLPINPVKDADGNNLCVSIVWPGRYSEDPYVGSYGRKSTSCTS